MSKTSALLQVLWEQNRARFVLTLVLLVVIIAALLGQQFFVEPHLQSLSHEQFRLQQYIRQRQVDYANSGVPISTVEQLERNLQRFDDMVPAEENFSLLLGDLFGWAEETGLSITSINYSHEDKQKSTYLNYGLSFSVSGAYNQIKKFIHLLENSERILMIDSIALSGSSAKGKVEDVKLNIDLTTYFKGGES